VRQGAEHTCHTPTAPHAVRRERREERRGRRRGDRRGHARSCASERAHQSGSERADQEEVGERRSPSTPNPLTTTHESKRVSRKSKRVGEAGERGGGAGERGESTQLAPSLETRAARRCEAARTSRAPACPQHTPVTLDTILPHAACAPPRVSSCQLPLA